MKLNARKLMALAMVLAMLMSMLGTASGEQEVIDLGGGIVIDEGTVIDGGTDIDTQGQEGELEIELDEAEGLPDGAIDPEGGEDLNLGLGLNSAALEGNEEELAPVTEEAMNAGEPDGKSEATAFTTEDWNTLSKWIGEIDFEIKAREDGESSGNPTYFKYTGSDVNDVLKSIGTRNARYVVVNLGGHTIGRTNPNDDKPASESPCNKGCFFDFLEGELTLKNGTLSNGGNKQAGGAVYVRYGKLTMDGVTISNCRAAQGGAVYVEYGDFIMNNCTISNNTASGSEDSSEGGKGGGVCVNSGTFTMSGNSTISNNTASGDGSLGGGVCVTVDCQFTMNNGTISNNTAGVGGGVCVDERGTFNMKAGTISGNTANKASVKGCSVKVTKMTARTEYKAYVRAWMKVGGKKVYLGDSPEVHAITGGYDAKRCNAQSVKLNKSSVTLKVGKSTTLKATVKGVKSGKKVLQHVRKVRYYSSNVNVAIVNKTGKIKATGTGKCTVWAIANNGVRTSVKVVVK